MIDLKKIAERADHDLGVFQATEGAHQDPRHGLGLGVDINEFDGAEGPGVDVGRVGHMNTAAGPLVGSVEAAAMATSGTRAIIDPNGYFKTLRFGGDWHEWDYTQELLDDHQNHMHITFYSNSERPRQ